jgi:hypothetical protein
MLTTNWTQDFYEFRERINPSVRSTAMLFFRGFVVVEERNSFILVPLIRFQQFWIDLLWVFVNVQQATYDEAQLLGSYNGPWKSTVGTRACIMITINSCQFSELIFTQLNIEAIFNMRDWYQSVIFQKSIIFNHHRENLKSHIKSASLVGYSTE